MIKKEFNFICTKYNFPDTEDYKNMKIAFNKQLDTWDGTIDFWFTVWGDYKGKKVQLDLDFEENQDAVKFIKEIIEVLKTKV